MLKGLKILTVIGLGLVLAGCAGAPTMKYVSYKTDSMLGADQDGSIKFYLYGSLVTLVDGSPAPAAPAAAGRNSSAPDPAAQAKALLKADTPQTVADLDAMKDLPAKAVVSKKIDESTLYALVPNESFYYKPNISVTYVPNTHSIKTLGAAAEDNRVQVISAVGGILATLAPIALALDASPIAPKPQPKALPLPVVIDLTPVDFGANGDGTCVYDPNALDAAKSIPDNRWCAITGSGGDWQYSVGVKRLTPGTKDREGFFAEAGSSNVRVFPVPACQNVTLSVRPKDAAEHMDFEINVADSRRIATFKVPAKGTITPGDVCGADINVVSATSASPYDLANAVATQAAALLKAIKAADPNTSSAPAKAAAK